VYATATLILRDGDRAQDAVQDVLVSAWRDVRAVRDPDAWDAWLHRLTVRACYRLARKERRRNLVELHVEPDLEVAGAMDPSNSVVDRDDLERQLGRLAIDQRVVIVLHFYLGLQLAEVAGILDIPIGTAKSRLHRGLAVLRGAMGVTPQCARWTGHGAPGMNTDPLFEQRIVSALERAGPIREPEGLLDSVLSTVGRTRTRPRWLALIKEPPMHLHARVAVGSPTVRLAYLAILTLLMTILATGAVVAGASLLPAPAIVVAQDGSGTVRTITEAVAMARDGGTVVVKPGTYPESITITADITLRGDGDRGAVVIEFAADGPTYGSEVEPFTFAYGILLDDGAAQVENLTVRGRPNAGGEQPISAVVIVSGSPVIERLNVILDGEPWPDYPYFMRSAIQIFGGSTVVVRDSSWDGYTRMAGLANSPTFEGNVVTGQHIAVTGGGQNPVIRGNTFLDGAAIRWDSTGSGGLAEENDIDGWIGVDELNHPVIRGNHIRHGGVPDPGSGYRGAAIKISSGARPVVEDNEITDSPYGIEVAGSGAAPVIRGNTIRGSGNVAIIVDNGAAPTIDGNVIEGNATAIEVLGLRSP